MTDEIDPPNQGCPMPPEGWWCSREPGHDGPCAARSIEEIQPDDSAAHACIRRLLDGWSYDPIARRWYAWSQRDSMNVRRYSQRRATPAESDAMAQHFGRTKHS